MEKAVLRVPIKRHCRKAIVAAPFGRSTEPVVLRPCFNTDSFKNGQAIRMQYHTGEVTSGVIADSTKDWLKVYIVDKLGEVLVREIYLEDYLNGAWVIKLL